MKEISNEDFDKALKDTNNIKIMNAVIKKYSKSLPHDELESIRLCSLWKCLAGHDDSKGNAFTTSLYNFTRWECLKTIKKYDVPKTYQLHDSYSYSSNSKYADIMVSLNETDRNMITKYVEGKYTLTEIGAEYGYSKEWARDKINKIKEKIRVMSDGVL